MEVEGMDNKLQCKESDKVFKTKSGLIGDSVLQKEKNFQCTTCGQKFTYKGHLDRHVKVHTQVKEEIKCQVCDKLFTYKSQLDRHSVVHTGEKPFQCTICGNKFGHKRVLDAHLKIHGIREKEHECLKCGKSFLTKQHLDNHANVHTGEKKFNCTKCGKKFSRYSWLSRHETLIHHSGPKEHKCLDCGKAFVLKRQLKVHAFIHTGEKFKCEKCGKCFSWLSQMQNHRNRKVPCDKIFQNQRETSGLKKHQCSKCGKSFKYKSQLEDHVVVHTGERKFKCTKCGNKFRYRSTLHRHKANKNHCVDNLVNLNVEQHVPDNTELQHPTPNSGATSDNVAPLKCWVCGEEPGFKSDLMDQFQPQNMGFRYMCPRCDEHLECANNLGDYFKTFNNISELVEDTKIVKEEPVENL